MGRKVDRIRLVVGSPEPKHIHQTFGGPTVAFQLRDDQQVQLSVEALDAEGNPANVTTAWSSNDTSVASVDANGLVTASPGAAGLGAATISADVTDASDGDVHQGTFDVEVVAGDAVVVNITAGEPTDKAPVEDVPPDDGETPNPDTTTPTI